MNRRRLIRLSLPLLAGAPALSAATCVSSLDAVTATEYGAYLTRVLPQMERPLEPGLLKQTSLGGEPNVWNINASGPNGVFEISRGSVIHWAGAIRIKVAGIDGLERVLTRYDMYTRWYAPYMAACRATPAAGSASLKQFRIVTVLHDVVEKPAPFLPDMHFSFEINSVSGFRRTGNPASPTLLVSNRAESIRESNSGEPRRADSGDPTNDLMRPDYGHGILWRSETRWRAIQSGDSVYAEYQSVSLARSLDAISVISPCAILRLPGLRSKALEAMTERPRRVVTSVLRQTRLACEQV